MNQTVFELDAVKNKLAKFNQEHVLKYWDELSAQQQASLAEQIDNIDFEQLQNLAAQKSDATKWGELADKAVSPPSITLEQFRDSKSNDAAYELGAEAIKAGKVGMILTAGGQGSRLGFEHPKGMLSLIHI